MDVEGVTVMSKERKRREVEWSCRLEKKVVPPITPLIDGGGRWSCKRGGEGGKEKIAFLFEKGGGDGIMWGEGSSKKGSPLIYFFLSKSKNTLVSQEQEGRTQQESVYGIS